MKEKEEYITVDELLKVHDRIDRVNSRRFFDLVCLGIVIVLVITNVKDKK